VTGRQDTGSRTNWKAALLSAVGACALLAGLGPAVSADAVAFADGKPALWIITLGGYGLIEPKTEGSKTYHATGRPVFAVRRSTDREWLSLPNDSSDFELFETAQLRAGPVVSGRWGSAGPAMERGTRKLNVGNTAVAVSLEAGAFLEYWPVEWLRTRVEVRTAAVGGSGVTADLTADAIWRADGALTVNAGPRLAVADGAYMDTYYGVSAPQAAAANIAKFDADAGLKSYGFGAGFRYKLSSQLTGLGFLEYQHLAGSAAQSSVVSAQGTPNQISIGLGASYDLHLDW
jgi:MipA family protein